MEVLGRHIPDFSPSAQLPEGGVNVSGTKTTALESTGSANDTSQNKVSVEVSGTQATENKEAAIRADTLTPISVGTAGDEEDVL